MANKSRSKGAEAQANRYKTEKRWETNRLARLLRAQKKNPENKQIAEAMKSMVYRRGTPKSSQWSHTKINTAKLFKKFSGKVHTDIFSSNEKVASTALMLHGKVKAGKGQPGDRDFFKIGTRAHNGQGALVWA